MPTGDPPAPTRTELVRYLVHTGIAGQVDTPRESNLRSYRKLAEGIPYYQFGLTFRRAWSPREILALMSKNCGVIADEHYLRGMDTIDPDRTADGLEAVADRLAVAARRRERVLFATGHPANLLHTYRRWRSVAVAAGANAITPALGATYEVRSDRGRLRRVVEWQHGVGYVSDGSAPIHSHHPDGMHAMIAACGEERPDLVVADHAFAGAAAEAGIEVVCIADCNDPALFVAAAEDKVHTCVPLDDGYDTERYAPLASYVADRLTDAVGAGGATSASGAVGI
ncbi:phosphatase [Spiractinospora alimapuensis]|uniref:phosphatase n=1 Tax=Spiractinospora alimapuensis TaxID=2820884 RepID=UPI001F359880|nr:phosphatase [Spiractinospora alimapuensis]QVQ50975.1 phosphatase [Spiractinospora alimapuensis]